MRTPRRIPPVEDDALLQITCSPLVWILGLTVGALIVEASGGVTVFLGGWLSGATLGSLVPLAALTVRRLLRATRAR